MGENAFAASRSAPDPTGGAYRLALSPEPLAGFGEGKGVKRGKQGKGGREREIEGLREATWEAYCLILGAEGRWTPLGGDT